MHKVAIVIYSDLKGEGLSANFRALNFAEELIAAGDEVRLIYDGSGSKSLSEIMATDHRLHRAFTKAESHLFGACRECAKAYGVFDALEEAGVTMLAEFKGHASLRRHLNDGFQIVTF